MHHRFLKGLYHFTVYAVGISVLLAAIGVTIIRLLLPDIGMYRSEIQAWVSNYTGFPVAVRSLDASWEGWIPQLSLRDIDLLNRDGTEVLTHFDNARISIAPLATLIQRQFVPKRLLVSGFELSVHRQEDGSIHIQGLPLEQQATPLSQGNDVAEWLFRQNRIEIQKGRIEWVDRLHGQEPILLREVRLLLRSDMDRIQIEGAARLPRLYGERLDFAFDARGDLMTSNWSGQLYLEGKNINPDQWYRKYRPFDFNVAGGTADIRVWSDWDRARPHGIQGQLKYSEFSVSLGDQSLRVDELDYSFYGEKQDDRGWRFSVNLNNFVTEHGVWPETRLSLLAEPLPDGQGHDLAARFSYLRLEDLAPLLTNLSFLPEEARQRLEQLQLQGDLIDGEVHYRPRAEASRRLSYAIQFDQFAGRLGEGLPVLESLSGYASGTFAGGTVLFRGDRGRLRLAGEGVDAITLTAIDGSLDWRKTESGTTLHTHLLTLANDDLSARLSGSARLVPGGSPFLDIVAELGYIDLETFTGYIPYTPRFKMRHWMEKAVLGGDLKSATALLRGNLSDFPFRKREGQFKVIANIDKGVMEYSDKWPIVDNINTEVVVEAQRVSAAFNHGQVYDATFNQGRLLIPDVFRKQKHIYVDGRVHGEASDLKNFIADSPLAADPSLREAQKALVSGDFTLDLDMHIPFKIPDAVPDIGGSMELNDAHLISATGALELTQLAGRIDFSKGSVSGDGLTAVYAGRPVKLGIDGSKDGAASQTAISMHGRADAAFIADQVEQRLPDLPLERQLILDRIAGSTDWTATLDYRKPAGAEKLQRSVTLESELQGLTVSLPAPLDKPAAATKHLQVFRSLNKSEPSLIRLIYGDNLHIECTLSPIEGEALSGASIHFGQDDAVSDQKGIHLSGRIDSLSVVEWWTFLKDAGMTGGGKSRQPLEAELKIGGLDLFSQHLTDVGLKILSGDDQWRLDLDSEAVAGQMLVPIPLQRDRRIALDLERLHLQDIKPETHSQLDPHVIPGLEVSIGDFKYGDKELGSLQLNAAPSEEGLVFNTISFSKPGLTIHGEGNWASREEGEQSSFAIEVHADRIDTMLNTFGYEGSTIRKGETDLLINADWQGTPMQFSLEKLNGTISMHIGKGQLLDVDPAAGRLFGLLSIQALPRRLTLDFRDLFGKGMAFDRMEGNFDVTNGNAYTNDLYMQGPAVEVAISGRTGLSQKDYDQRVTVTPRVTGNLPVAGALFGPVGIGIGTIFYLAGEMFESVRSNIDNLLRYDYTITGSWDDPVVEKITPAQEATNG